MKTCGLALVLLAAVTGCSEKRQVKQPEAEHEQQPREDEIAEDCVAFVRSTKVVTRRTADGECPGCAAAGAEVLRFQRLKMQRINCAKATCEVAVTIGAVFNRGTGENIGGGLTAWITPEKREAYLRGDAPADEQLYPVKITYKRNGESWRAVEFDKGE